MTPLDPSTDPDLIRADGEGMIDRREDDCAYHDTHAECVAEDARIAAEAEKHHPVNTDPPKHCEYVYTGGCAHPCRLAAEWQIVDRADFDPTTCVTLACSSHLADLIGHHTTLPEGVTNLWEIRPVDAAAVGRASQDEADSGAEEDTRHPHLTGLSERCKRHLDLADAVIAAHLQEPPVSPAAIERVYQWLTAPASQLSIGEIARNAHEQRRQRIGFLESVLDGIAQKALHAQAHGSRGTTLTDIHNAAQTALQRPREGTRVRCLMPHRGEQGTVVSWDRDLGVALVTWDDLSGLPPEGVEPGEYEMLS